MNLVRQVFHPAVILSLVGICVGCPNPSPLEPDAGFPATDASPVEADAGLTEPDAGQILDAGQPDASEPDAGQPDASEPDAGQPDASEPDAGQPDASEPDAGQIVVDAGEPDAGQIVVDAGQPDAGQTAADAGQPDATPIAGNPAAPCPIPVEAALEDVSNPDQVVGNGTPASCTSNATINAIAQGGVITFDCGPAPVVITLDRPAQIFNDTGPRIVIDGGGLVTLSGGGTNRILYMNTCDPALVWTTPNCQNQDHPQLTLQNITFADGDSQADTVNDGGGAVWVRGGRLKLINTRFFNNICASPGIDVGGGGLRVFSQYNDLPVYVVNSTFGGAPGYGNEGSNGGGISSIGVSWTIINSVFTHNRATGMGGHPPQPGTPGGGSGGAIYNDGNQMTLSLCGTILQHNEAIQHGSAIIFVSNDLSGDIRIDRSTITDNLGGTWYPTYPQISNHAATPIVVINSVIQP